MPPERRGMRNLAHKLDRVFAFITSAFVGMVAGVFVSLFCGIAVCLCVVLLMSMIIQSAINRTALAIDALWDHGSELALDMWHLTLFLFINSQQPRLSGSPAPRVAATPAPARSRELSDVELAAVIGKDIIAMVCNGCVLAWRTLVDLGRHIRFRVTGW